MRVYRRCLGKVYRKVFEEVRGGFIGRCLVMVDGRCLVRVYGRCLGRVYRRCLGDGL